MKIINIKVKKKDGQRFTDTQCLGVMGTIRKMSAEEQILFPMDWKEAVSASTCILRKKENLNVRYKTTVHDDKKYLIVVKTC